MVQICNQLRVLFLRKTLFWKVRLKTSAAEGGGGGVVADFVEARMVLK
jgi:hypothetical protein